MPLAINYNENGCHRKGKTLRCPTLIAWTLACDIHAASEVETKFPTYIVLKGTVYVHINSLFLDPRPLINHTFLNQHLSFSILYDTFRHSSAQVVETAHSAILYYLLHKETLSMTRPELFSVGRRKDFRVQWKFNSKFGFFLQIPYLHSIWPQMNCFLLRLTKLWCQNVLLFSLARAEKDCKFTSPLYFLFSNGIYWQSLHRRSTTIHSEDLSDVTDDVWLANRISFRVRSLRMEVRLIVANQNRTQIHAIVYKQKPSL